jgi:hypothetical protein
MSAKGSSVLSMKRTARLITSVLVIVLMPTGIANAWDPQPTNPFPGVAYGAEIPGYTVQIPCRTDDCGIGIVPVVDCPPWSAADGGGGFDVGYAKRFCRNSWTPPTSSADEDDFRNRQQLAIAAATIESQAFSASHPGEQQCVTWGPVVHANGISTASGGVCANVVGTKPDGTTGQVPPSQVGTPSSGSQQAAETNTVTSANPQTIATPSLDLTQYGIGRPFTQVVPGNSSSQCPSGYQAASNSLQGILSGGAIECWPANAWAAYSIGGDVWSQFKSSNGSINAEAESARRVQVNAIRALALQQAQQLANQTIGIKRCATWSGFGESGQECAYIPIQNNSIGGILTSSNGDTSTTQIKTAKEVVVAKISSTPGQTQADWEKSDSYTSFNCPSGSGKSLSIDLKGTVSKSDDVWILSCVEVVGDSNSQGDSLTATSSGTQESTTAVSGGQSQVIGSQNSDSNTVISQDTVDFKGTVSQILVVAQNLLLSKSESIAISSTLNKLTSLKPSSSLVKISLPNSPVLIETARSLTPTICKVSGLVVQPKKAGVCQISYTVEGNSGNSFEATKKMTFKK